MEDVRILQRRSLGDRVWEDPELTMRPIALRAFCDNLGISKALGRILALRGLQDEEAALKFLHPDASQLHPPFLMLGMREAVQRIVRAIENYEKILVFGDYDVDGTASAGIIYGYLKRLGARVYYYIPHRISDGYGFSPVTVRKIAGWQPDLVITCDHGSTEMDAAAALKPHGVDLIITDHHQLGASRPPALALVNPHQPGCPYPFKELAAAGVAYKLICALDQQLTELNFWNHRGLCHTEPSYYLDLVALATVADMAPLVGENRVLVKIGLDALNSRLKPGLSGLVKECRVRGPITPTTISFKLAPKINALGRVGDPRLGMQLLLSHSFTEARRLARYLLEVNRKRQEIEREVYADVSEQIERMPRHAALILVGQGWHPGVIGSIATRVAHQTRRPTVVLSQEKTPQMVGSARSSENYNVLKVLDACQSLLERYGGHPSAAGLALHPINLTAFTEFFQSAAERDGQGVVAHKNHKLKIEAWIEPEELTPPFLQELFRLSPFGYGNPEPVVGVHAFQVDNPSVFQNRHLKFSLACENGAHLEAFAWEHSDWEVSSATRYDIAFMPQVHIGAEGVRSQLRVLDLKAAE